MKKIILTLLFVLCYYTPLKEEYVYIPQEIVIEDTNNKPIETKIQIVERIPVELTAYDNCYSCTQNIKAKGITASGVRASRGSIAAPSSIPFNTVIYIDGIKHTVHDRGQAIKIVKGVYIFDVWFPSHIEALKFGRKKGYMYKKDNEYYIEVEG